MASPATEDVGLPVATVGAATAPGDLRLVQIKTGTFSSSGSSISSSDHSDSSSGSGSPEPRSLPRVVENIDPASTATRDHHRRRDGEFIAEPEWQRAAGRWSKREESLLREMKLLLEEDLRAAPPFPEVVGSRRMLRFLR